MQKSSNLDGKMIMEMSEPKRRSQEQIINDLHELVRQIENDQRMKERQKYNER